jgi:hypothetical protein
MADVPAELVNRLVAARREYRFPPQVRPLAHAFSGKVLATPFPRLASEVVRQENGVRDELLQVEGALRSEHTARAGLATRFLGELAVIQ